MVVDGVGPVVVESDPVVVEEADPDEVCVVEAEADVEVVPKSEAVAAEHVSQIK